MKPWIQVIAEYLEANQPLNGSWLQAIADALANLPQPIATHIVDTFADLPDPTLNNNLFVWVKNSTGIYWIPSWAGGNYKSNGLYYSDGITWEPTNLPFQALLTEVNIGTNNEKFITPYTLTNSNLAKDFQWTFDYMDGILTFTFYAPINFKINSITNILNAPTTEIKVNDVTYTLTNTINTSDKVEVIVDTISVIKLNITKL